MPCSLESNVWLSVFCEHDHHGQVERDKIDIPHLNLSHSSSSRLPEAAQGRTPEYLQLQLPDDNPGPLGGWPLAGIFSVLSSEASELVKHAKSKGLHTRIVPKSVGFRARDTGPTSERDNRWIMVLGTDPAAVARLFEIRFRAGQSAEEAQITRKADRDWLWLSMAGALGGLVVWRLFCL